MSIPSRIWRLIRAEVNSRLGNFESERAFEEDSWKETEERYKQPPTQETSNLEAAYRALELPYGADLVAVRAAYKQLMKRYHPDKFQDAEQRASATELVKKINAAYAELSHHLSE